MSEREDDTIIGPPLSDYLSGQAMGRLNERDRFVDDDVKWSVDHTRAPGKITRPQGGEVTSAMQNAVINDRLITMVEYLKAKVDEGDWHAVTDAAIDIRVLEAKKR